ncbi:MAG: ATP/GTP-binding protein [Cyanobacteria bacterium NC_groundwater_1444_Ag_S-0.65um_54_12]|nr:ATP/GTP-binding protein [Cyanobacteria bacterium NC_groundwater_1444_Ag_S-0.65um_54_12]
MVSSYEELARRVSAGDRWACGRFLTLIENRDPAALAQLPGLRLDRAFRIGITGPPGVGKSTLIGQLVSAIRATGERVGVLAIDPSSPCSRGAVLGDRISLQAHTADPEVFIRSMANRGCLGGLAAATGSACRVLEAYGCQVLILETVGVGQAEVEIATVADTTVLLLSPHGPDQIQLLKAGIMEVSELFVINKADLPGALALAQQLATMLSERALAQTKSALPVAVQRIFLARGLGTLEKSGVVEIWQTLKQLRAQPLAKAWSNLGHAAIISEALLLLRERLQALIDTSGLPDAADRHAAASQLVERLLESGTKPANSLPLAKTTTPL